MQRTPSRKANIPESQDASRQMRRASEKMRASLEGNRSDKLLRLFEFLLERTLAGDPPTEQQIAEGVFSTGQTDGPRPDANVRVYVHRLRKLIGATFADTPGPRLDLPPGAYKLRLITPPSGEDAEPEELSNPIARRRIWRAGRWGAAILLGAGFALLAVISLMVPLYDAGPRLNSAMPWAAISDSDRPITIVMGDYFLYAEFGGQRDRRSTPKLIWDQGVPTREDLIIYQILNPANADAVADLDQQYVTSATLTAATAIRSALRRDAVFQRRPASEAPALEPSLSSGRRRAGDGAICGGCRRPVPNPLGMHDPPNDRRCAEIDAAHGAHLKQHLKPPGRPGHGHRQGVQPHGIGRKLGHFLEACVANAGDDQNVVSRRAGQSGEVSVIPSRDLLVP